MLQFILKNLSLQSSFYVLFCLCFACPVQSQVNDTVFNRIYDVGTDHLNQSPSVLETKNGYIANIYDIYEPSFSQQYGYLILDNRGNKEAIKTFSLNDDATGIKNGFFMIRTIDSNFLDTRILQYHDTSNHNTNFTKLFLIKANSSGDTIWTREVSSSHSKYIDARSTVQLSDSNYISVSVDYEMSNEINPVIFKLSGKGQLLKEELITTSNNSFLYHCVQHTNGDLYFTGISNSHTSGVSYSTVIMRMDTALNLKWIKHIGPETGTSGKPVLLSTGEILIPAGKIVRQFGSQTLERKLLMKVDTSGTVVWSKLYGEEGHLHRFEYAIELPDSSWAVLGRNRKERLGSGIWHSLMKMNPQGDSLWEVDYVYQGFNGSDDLWSLAATSDGGFIMSGDSFGEDQDSWINKVDSNGIGVFVADTTSWVPPSTGSEYDGLGTSYRISPNPSNGKATISWSEESETPAVLVLYNMQGQELGRISAPQNGQEVSFNVPNGAYVLAFKNHTEAILSRLRVVVE